MKNKNVKLIVLALLMSTPILSQENKTDNSIQAQFNNLIERSNTYQSYKVVPISELNILQRNIRDSIRNLQTTISDFEHLTQEQNKNIDSITHQIENLELDLKNTQENADSISLLGISTQKSSYKTIMWTIIIGLLGLSIILFSLFKKGHSDTKEAKNKLQEVETELEDLRKSSLEREQKVRRQLQDEINKNKMK